MDDTPPPLPEAPKPAREVPPVDVLGCYERSFALFRSTPFTLIAAAFLVLAPSLASSAWLVTQMMRHPENLLLWPSQVFGATTEHLLSAALVSVVLAGVRTGKTRLGELGRPFREAFFRLVISSLILNGLSFGLNYGANHLSADPAITSLASAFALGVTLVIDLLFCFVPALILDRGLHVGEAFSTSRRLFMSQPLRIIGLLLLGLLLFILGALAVGVGIFIAVPIAAGAFLFAYEDLVKATE